MFMGLQWSASRCVDHFCHFQGRPNGGCVFALSPHCWETYFSPYLTYVVFSFFRIQILTGKVPFDRIRHDTVVINQVQMGRRPPREHYQLPEGCEDVWSLLEDCWNQIASKRPTMDQVVERLTKIA